MLKKSRQEKNTNKKTQEMRSEITETKKNQKSLGNAKEATRKKGNQQQ